jgi:hypothetical protein
VSTQDKLEQIEKKVTEARVLINEAKALAEDLGVDFLVEVTGTFTATEGSGSSDFESSEEWNDSGCSF